MKSFLFTRVIGILLTVIFIVTNCFSGITNVAMADEKESVFNEVDIEALDAYYEAFVQSVGEDTSVGSNVSEGMAIKFIDFDNDGVEEMVLLPYYFRDCYELEMLEIYTYKNGKVSEIETEGAQKAIECATAGGTHGGLCEVGFANANGKNLLIVKDFKNNDEWLSNDFKKDSYSFYTTICNVENGEINVYNKIEKNMVAYQGSSDEEFKKYKDVEEISFYRINDNNKEEITEQEYYGISEEYGIISDEFSCAIKDGMNITFDELTTDIITQWKNILQQYGYKQNNLENIYETMQRDQKLKMIKYLNKFTDGSGLNVYDIADEQKDLFYFCASAYYELHPEVENNWELTDPNKSIYCTNLTKENIYEVTQNYFGMKFLPSGTEYYHHPAYEIDGVYYAQGGFGFSPFVTPLQEVYDLGNGLYYTTFLRLETTGLAAQPLDTNEYLPYEEWSDNFKQQLGWSENDSKGYALFQEYGDSYTLLKYDSDGALTYNELKNYVKNYQPASNIIFDYESLINETDINVLADILKNKISSKVPNINGLSEIRQYIQYCLEKTTQENLKTKSNKILIDMEVIQNAIEINDQGYDKFTSILEDEDIELNKNVEKTLCINATGINSNKKIKIEFKDIDLTLLDEAEKIKIFFGNNNYGMYVDGKNLKTLLEKYKDFRIEIEKNEKENSYSIVFFDGNTKMTSIASNITFFLQSNDPNSYIFAKTPQFSENWGGQYDLKNKKIEFSTIYSGTYSVNNEAAKINDILAYSEEEKTAIEFMISKGYFDLNDGNFNGNDFFNRNEFTKAMVKIFYALNLESNTTFSDVDVDGIYYHYISSSQNSGIVKGYEDNTFRGENYIPKEQVIALCGRILSDKMNYKYPDNIEEFLEFADRENIDDWALSDIAVSVENDLLACGGNLLPQTEITRKEAAVLLYRLFMLMYETSPAEVPVDDIETSSNVLYLFLGACIFAGGLAIFFRTRKNIER